MTMARLRIGRWPAVLAGPAWARKTRGGSMSANMGPVPGWLSFRRIVDVPFETCVAALDSWQPIGAGRRPAVRRQPVARAGRARSRLGHVPDPGPPGPGTAAPAAAHETGHRPLVLLVHRCRAHPLRARPAHRRLFPRRPSPARLADPLPAAAPDASAHPGHREPATREIGRA